MTDMVKVSPRVGRFFGKMLSKLSEHGNQDKGDWRECSAEWLLRRIEEELEELRGAMIRQDRIDVAQECADVANFAFMLADICNARSNKSVRWFA